MKTRIWPWLFAIPLVAAIGGCIVHDQLITLTVHPDGSGSLTVFRSNIRSTEEGEKGEAEIAEFRNAFDGQTQGEFKQIRESGARIEMASWIRKQVPLANVLQAAIPDSATMEKLTTLKDNDGKDFVQSKFTISNTQRRLSFQVTLKAEGDSTQGVVAEDVRTMKLARASGLSDLRIALSKGEITEARGFTIAEDRQSALFDPYEFKSLVKTGKGNVELFVQWEVPN